MKPNCTRCFTIIQYFVIKNKYKQDVLYDIANIFKFWILGV